MSPLVAFLARCLSVPQVHGASGDLRHIQYYDFGGRMIVGFLGRANESGTEVSVIDDKADGTGSILCEFNVACDAARELEAYARELGGTRHAAGITPHRP